MPGIGIIANPHSKSNKRSMLEVRRMTGQLGQSDYITVTRDLEHLDETLKEYKRLALDWIGINGGDGTVSQVITRLIHLYGPQNCPAVLVLGGGTMNLVARQLGLIQRPHQILAEMKARQSATDRLVFERLMTLKVNGHFGFLYADQSSTAILEEYYLKKNGHAGAIWLSVRLVKSCLSKGSLIKKLVQKHRVELDFRPQGRFEAETLGCFAASITKFPLDLPFLQNARRDKGFFQAMAVTCSPEKLLWYMPRLMLKHKDGPNDGLISYCSQCLFLDYKSTSHFTVDGEIYVADDGRISIESGPELLFLRR